jgi:hypothetical protein
VTELSEVPSTSNPLGLRGGGEGGTTPALGTDVNTVVDALAEFGVEHLDMPVTPERVWRAIHGGNRLWDMTTPRARGALRCSISSRISPARRERRRRWRGPPPAPAKTPGFSSSPITACRSIWATIPSPSPRNVKFFARPEGDKLALKIGKHNIGYPPFGGQVVRHSPVNKNTKPNFSESFYITRTRT